MASTRDVIAPPIFAEDASTTIPPTPIAGQSYRDPVAGPASSSGGWPYAQLVNSAEWNQLMFQWSSLLAIQDLKGLLGWSDLKDYTEDAISFGSDGKVYKWLQESGPGTAAGVRDPVSEPLYWSVFGEDSTDFLNTTRIDVSSASTVDLTTAAPNTRHINITGGGVINGFTVLAGQCYFARFNASGVLTNSASLVTQSGENIITGAGDTCLIRATASNTVEILCFTKAISQSLGDGQTVQTLTGSRAFGTTYTNSTGRPIFVSVVVSTTGPSTVAGGPVKLAVGASEYVGIAPAGSGANWSLVVTGVIPPGATYSVANSNSFTLNNWTELR